MRVWGWARGERQGALQVSGFGEVDSEFLCYTLEDKHPCPRDLCKKEKGERPRFWEGNRTCGLHLLT